MSFTALPTPEDFNNDMTTTLSSGAAPGDATMSLSSITGWSTVGQFRILVDDEWMLVTGYDPVAKAWQVTRGIEGSTAATHASGATVYPVVTAGAIAGIKTGVRKVNSIATGNVTVKWTGTTPYEIVQPVSTEGGPVTLTLQGAVHGCRLRVIDSSGTFATNNCELVDGGGADFMPLDGESAIGATLTLNVSRESVQLDYVAGDPVNSNIWVSG